MPPIPLPSEIRSLVSGTPLVLLLDVDGTLAPLVPHHEDARVPDATRAVLSRLARHADVRVALVSGRSADVAHQIVGVEGVWVCGNHGCELLTPGGERREEPEAVARIGAIAEAVRQLRAIVPNYSGLTVEDKRLTLSVHEGHVDLAKRGTLHADVQRIADTLGIRVTRGKAILELRPTTDIHKGTAVMAIARELGGLDPGASLLFAGDDVTDEDAFRTLAQEAPHAVTVCVTEEPSVSAARYAVSDTDAMARVLAQIAEAVEARAARQSVGS